MAADNWRLHEARNLIRSVEIELDDGDRQPVFHHVTVTTGDQTERYYQERVTLAQRTDEYSLAMTEAAAYLEGAVARYRSLMTLARTKQRPSQEQEKLALLHQTLGTARVLASQLQ